MEVTYKLITSLQEVDTKWLEEAIYQFVEESKVKGDPQGLVKQTLENVLHSTELRTPGRYFWLLEIEGKPQGYILTNVSKDVDNSLCYWVVQAYACPEVRGTQEVKDFYKELKKHAKQLFCKHILLPVSREEKLYTRWLGENNLHHYSQILKEDI